MSLTKYKSPFDSFFNDDYFFSPLLKSSFLERDWTPKTCAVDLKDDKLIVAFSVLGHDPKNVQVECTDKDVTVTAKTNLEEDKNGVLSQYVRNFTQKFNLTDEYNGEDAVAEIKNGILTITVPKSEKFTKRPKALQIKYSG